MEIRITKQALKDIRTFLLKIKKKLKDIFNEVLAVTPYEGKRLLGDLEGNFSMRLNIRDRIVYSIDEEKKVVYVKRARTYMGVRYICQYYQKYPGNLTFFLFLTECSSTGRLFSRRLSFFGNVDRFQMFPQSAAFFV